MKIFLSYRFTGEDPLELKGVLKSITDSLKKAGHETFCSFFKEEFFKKNKYTNRQILEFALNELDTCDAYLAFIKSEQKSEGMLMEAGYALAKDKKFYLAIKKNTYTTFMKEMANTVIEYETLEELYKKLEKLR